MTALTKDRGTARRDGIDFHDPLEASVKIFAGAIVCLNAAGNAVPGAATATLKVRGVAQEHVDNTDGLAGALSVASMQGTFHFANDGSVARADIGGNAYIVDDQTVADNDGSATRPLCGVIVDVDAAGAWVRIG